MFTRKKKRILWKYQYFKSPIVLTKNNVLVDGYTTYLLAKEKKFDYITILRKKWNSWTISAIYVQSFLLAIEKIATR